MNGWPARAYVYGTWEYAFNQTVQRAKSRGLKMWLYKSELNGEPVWVSSWDPRKE